MTGAPYLVGVSHKSYFDHAQAARWIDEAAAAVLAHPAVESGRVGVFVCPTLPSIPRAVAAFGERADIAAQTVSAYGPGPYTGEVAAIELRDIGCTLVEIGHAERRRLFGETDEMIALKVAQTVAAGMTPLLCVGEPDQGSAADAVGDIADQIERACSALSGEERSGTLLLAYEPVWAIGAPAPAPAEFVHDVVAGLRAEAVRRWDGTVRVVYGGSAGPGTATALGTGVDGVFLGRFAHDPQAFADVLDEAAVLLTSG